MKLELTKAEEKVMKILWDIEKGLIRDVVQEYENPKPQCHLVKTQIALL